MKKKIIKELNNFLKGNFMAVHAYDKYIHHIDDASLREILQKIQQDHKEHAAMIAERVQNLGGIPADDVGMMGNIAEFMNKLKGTPQDSALILQDALNGEYRGIEKSKEILDNDLDPESLTLVKHILNVDEKHVDLLDRLMNGSTI